MSEHDNNIMWTLGFSCKSIRELLALVAYWYIREDFEKIIKKFYSLTVFVTY